MIARQEVQDTPSFLGNAHNQHNNMHESQFSRVQNLNIMSFQHSYTSSQQDPRQSIPLQNQSINDLNSSEYSRILKNPLSGSGQNQFIVSDAIGHQVIEGSQHQLHDCDLEEFLKSTNSALSDYNFLFENIDQQLQNNTQLMVEELGKNVPEYLMNTNSSINKEENKSASEILKDIHNEMPRIIKEPLPQRTGYGENSSSQIDLTDDEIISIEDTYRETCGAMKKEQSLEETQQNNRNKSMTIIEEESEFDESSMLNNMQSQASLKLTSQLKTQKELKNSHSLVYSQTSNRLNFKESFETFGGNEQQPTQHDFKSCKEKIYQTDKRTDNASTTHESNPVNQMYVKNAFSNENQGPTAAATLENADSKSVTLRSPIMMRTNESVQSTLTGNQILDQMTINEKQKDNTQDRTHNSSGVQDMLKKYQEKYKKQKEESMKLCDTNKSYIEIKENKYQNEYEDKTESGEEYVNRSFVSTQMRTKMKQEGTHNSRPFDFIENSSQEINANTQSQELRNIYDIEIQNYQQQIQQLIEHLKIIENQKLKVEKQVLQQQIQFDQEQRIRDQQYLREFKLKENEIRILEKAIQDQIDVHDQKLENQRERLKTVEKTVYQRVEFEYSKILQEKEIQIEALRQELEDKERQIKKFKDDLDAERVKSEIDYQSRKIQDRQILLEEKEQIHHRVINDSEKEMRMYKERIEQDYQFKLSQLEQKYRQQLRMKEQELEREKELFQQEKHQEISQLKATEISKLEEEKLRNHAKTTQVIYEDISKVLVDKNKEEQKRLIKKLKQDYERDLNDKVYSLENNYQALLAKERKEKSKVELKNAQLENQIYEMKERMKTLENTVSSDKENKDINLKKDKELAMKLKKLNKTMTIK